MTNANDPAYPTGEETKTGLVQGLTKREMFSAMAMQGIMASSMGWPDGNPQHMEEAARRAVNAADALIKQLNSTDK